MIKDTKNLLEFWETQMKQSHRSSNYFFRKSPSHYHMMLLVMSAHKNDQELSVEELKIINGGHDWPAPLSAWGNQDINANIEIWNFLSKYEMDGLIGCNSTSYSDIQNSNSKNLVRVVDILGKVTENRNNQVIFYIFSDGSVEKKIIIE